MLLFLHISISHIDPKLVYPFSKSVWNSFQTANNSGYFNHLLPYSTTSLLVLSGLHIIYSVLLYLLFFCSFQLIYISDFTCPIVLFQSNSDMPWFFLSFFLFLRYMFETLMCPFQIKLSTQLPMHISSDAVITITVLFLRRAAESIVVLNPFGIDSSDLAEGREPFRCDYGGCISPQFMCNGHLDCWDGSDETQELCFHRTWGSADCCLYMMCKGKG